MNDEIEKAAEQMLQIFKDRGGMTPLHREAFREFPHVDRWSMEAVNLLEAFQLIERFGANRTYRVTAAGHSFTTFDDHRKEEQAEKEHRDVSRKLTKWQYAKEKLWWLIAIVSAVIGAVVHWLLTSAYTAGSQP